MSRQKPKAIIETIDDANDALYAIALSQLELQKIDTAASEKVALAQKEAELAGRELRSEIEKFEASILAFGEKKKEELFAESGKTTKSKKRSIELTFGRIGFQKSTSINIENDAATIELIEIKKKELARKLGLDAAVVREPKIKKTALTKFDDDTLGRFGISRKYEDAFFYETDIEAVNLDLQKTKAS